MSLQALVEKVAEFDTATIMSLLDTTHRDALNSRNALQTLREDLVTAGRSQERIDSELASIDARIAKEKATHARSMEQLARMRERWAMPPEEAQNTINEARTKAANTARLFNAVQKVAQAKQLSTSYPLGTNFDELLTE